MKIVVVTDKIIKDIMALHISDMTDEHKQKLVDSVSGHSLCDFMYGVMSTYMMGYMELYDSVAGVEEHNSIYDRFTLLGTQLGIRDPHVRSVNTVDNVLEFGAIDLYGSFCPNLYEDLYESMSESESMEADCKGLEYIESSAIHDNLEQIVELTKFTAKEIESRCLPRLDSDKQTSVMFGLNKGRLIIVVE